MNVLINKKYKLAESPIWHNNKLFFVDIIEKLLVIYDNSNITEISFDEYISSISPIDNNYYLITLKNGIFRYNINNKEISKISKLHLPEDMRFNDAKCDCNGNLWVGSMSISNPNKNRGNLYKINNKGEYKIMLKDTQISNGLCWSLDNKKMYFIDTPTQKIKIFDNNMNIIDFITINEKHGNPDGMTIDSNGNLWIAMWNGYKILNINPITKNIITEYNLPAKNITSLFFGGKDLSILYITSANIDSDNNKNDGNIFKIKTNIKGNNINYYKIN